MGPGMAQANRSGKLACLASGQRKLRGPQHLPLSLSPLMFCCLKSREAWASALCPATRDSLQERSLSFSFQGVYQPWLKGLGQLYLGVLHH